MLIIIGEERVLRGLVMYRDLENWCKNSAMIDQLGMIRLCVRVQ
jgi:hypothetical protein